MNNPSVLYDAILDNVKTATAFGGPGIMKIHTIGKTGFLKRAVLCRKG
jgi:hypothetical protein